MDFLDEELLDETYADVESMVKESIDDIRSMMSVASRYEQLAEECTELAHAALKKARKIRKESPTPLSMREIDSKISEEVADVELMLDICGLKSDLAIVQQKADRCIYRLRKSNDRARANSDL